MLDYMGGYIPVRVVTCEETLWCQCKQMNQGALDSLGQKTGGSRGPNSSLSSICVFCITKEGAGCWGAGSLAEKHQSVNLIYLSNINVSESLTNVCCHQMTCAFLHHLLTPGAENTGVVNHGPDLQPPGL